MQVLRVKKLFPALTSTKVNTFCPFALTWPPDVSLKGQILKELTGKQLIKQKSHDHSSMTVLLQVQTSKLLL